MAFTAAADGLQIPISGLELQASAAVELTGQFSAGLSDPTLTVTAMIQNALAVVGQLQLTPPVLTVTSGLDASAGLDVGLTAQIDLLKGFVDLNMLATMNTGGLYPFTYQGSIESLGASLDAVTPQTGVTGEVLGVVLLAKTPEARAALQVAFGI